MKTQPGLVLFFLFAGWLLPLATQAAGHADLIRVYGRASPTSFGGYTVSAGGLNQYYVIGIEVPPGASQLVIDIFDADVGAGGAADIGGDRDNQSGGAWDSFHIYTLYDEQLNFVPTGSYNYFYGDSASPPASDNAWTTFYSVANPAPGHWAMVVYPYDPASSGGAGASDDLNAFRVRAHDGNPGPGGTEFNVYMISPIPIGTNGVPGAVQSSARQPVYPYVTSGCQLNTHDFDSDVPNLPAGTPPLETQIQLTNRTGAYSHTVTQATMSGQDVWVNNVIGPVAGVAPSGTDYVRDGMGIWSGLLVANEQGSGGAVAGANYNEVIIADFANTTPVPSNAIEANTFRWYLPSDAGTAPQKTYVVQRVNFWSGPNPPVAGQTTEVEIEIEVFNPTAYPVTFSAADGDLVRSEIPAVPELAFVAGSVTVSQGTAPGLSGLAIPPAGGTGTLEWDPGVIAAGSSALLTYRISVTPSAAGQRIAVTGTPAAGGTTADFVDHTGNRNSPFANFTFGPLCELAVTEAQLVPTPVYLGYVLLSGQPGAYRLQWRTAFEAGNAAFRVYEQPVDAPEYLLAEVPVNRTGHIAGAEYAVDLSASSLEQVWIQDVALDGVKTWHGPFRLGQPFGAATVARLTRDKPTPLSIVNRSESLAQRAAWQQQQAVPELDLITDRAGVYRVSFDDLSALGYNYFGKASNSLRLLAGERIVPIVYNAGHTGIIQPGDYFEFIADSAKTLYSSQKAYRLTAGRPHLGAELSSMPQANMPAPAAVFAGRYQAVFEHDTAYSFSSPDTENDPWYWRDFLVRGEPLGVSIPFDMAVVDDSRPYSLLLDLWTMTDWPNVLKDHHVELLVNGVPVADFWGQGQGNNRIIGRIPEDILRAGQNSLELRFPADTGVAYELSYLDAFRITGQITPDSQLVAQAGQIAFLQDDGNDGQPLVDDIIFRQHFDIDALSQCQTGPCESLFVEGSESLLAYQRSGDRLWRIRPVTENGAQTLTLRPQTLAETWLVAEAAHYQPLVRPAATGDLPLTPGTDFLVIAPDAFVSALQPWVSARQARGYVVSVVSVENIYHHFSNGIEDGKAIAAFIAAAAEDNPLKHVLLVGSDRYDYNDRLGTGQQALLPGIYGATGPYVRYAPVDAAFGDVDQDGIPQISVGRWPVQSLQELQRMIDKTLAFEQKMQASGLLEALMLLDADDGDIDFSLLAEQQAPPLPTQWRIQYIDGNQADAKTQFMQQLTANPAVVEYLGHSSATQWSARAFLSSGEAQSVANDGLAMWFQWGCWNNYAVSPVYASLSEALLDGDTGAVLTLGATAIVDAKAELFVRQHFLRGLAQGQTVGQALIKAKSLLLESSGKTPQDLQDVLAGITILGDPSLRLVY